MASEGHKLPLGYKVPAVPRGTEIPPEPPDVGARSLSIATRLLAGATTFFFLAFAFAYFYLRALDQEGFWKPTAEMLKGQKEAHVSLSPDQALGAAFIACVVLSAALSLLAGRRMKRAAARWLAPAIGALVLGLAAVALQCIEYTVQHFGPTDGAYASIFCVWTALYLVAVLCTMYWLETQIATELRARRVPAESGDIAAPDTLIAPGLDASVFYWVFLAALGVIMYVILYLL